MGFIIALVLIIIIAAIWLIAYIIDALVGIGFAVVAFIIVYLIVRAINKSKRENY